MLCITKKNIKSFVLIELLIWITITAILTSLFLFVFRDVFILQHRARTMYKIDEEAYYISSLMRKELQSISSYRIDNHQKLIFSRDSLEAKDRKNDLFFQQEGNVLQRCVDNSKNIVSTNIEEFQIEVDENSGLLKISYVVAIDDYSNEFTTIIYMECNTYE